MTNAAVSLQNVWFSWPGSGLAGRAARRGSGPPLMQGFSLDIPAGETTAVLGPNGSGKTTLLRLILGTLEPQAGTLVVNGQPRPAGRRAGQSREMGLVPQEEHIPFSFSVLEYTLLGRAPHLRPLQVPGEDDRRIAWEALAAVGISELAGRPVTTLSGGERQLAVVARALAQRSQILLLDEPTAHLDLGNQGRMVQILRELAAGGMTLILTTHDPNLAAAVAGFVVLLRHGRVQDAGPAGAMLESARLSATYGVAVQVHRVDGRQVVLLP